MEEWTLANFLSLLALALVDSLSMGTLVIPLVLLLKWRHVRVAPYGAYLATIAASYFLIGTALFFGMRGVMEIFSQVAVTAWFSWTLLVLGAALFIFGVFSPNPVKKTAEEIMDAREQQADQKIRQSAGLLGIVSLAVGAAVLEAATMLPYLAAIGIIQSLPAPFAVQLGVLGLYCLVMVAPAVLIGCVARLWGDRVFEKIFTIMPRLEYEAKVTLLWVAAIVGVLMVRNSAIQLGLF